MTEEVWKPIPGYDGAYEVSNLGRVKSLRRYIQRVSHLGNAHLKLIHERILSPGVQKCGYLTVMLSDDLGKKTSWLIHKLVLLAFVGPPPKGLWGLHKDGFPSNCVLENLHYGTPTRNIQDVVFHGRRLLTDTQISALKGRKFAWGEQAVTARELGVSPQYLNWVISKAAYSYVV